MADEADKAVETQEAVQQHQIRKLRAQAQHQEVKATGWCLNCGDDVKKGARWCDAACRNDWERMSNKR